MFVLRVAIGVWTLTAAVASAQTTLTIRVVDQIGASPATRSDAIDTARSLLDHAGISAQWLVCDLARHSGDCNSPFSASDVSIRLVARPPKQRQSGLAISFLTVADGTGAYTSIFYDSTMAAAHRAICPPSLMLGYIMAHEVAHLLGLKHASQGIMKNTFGAKEMDLAGRGLLVFDERELRALRAAVHPRIQPAGPTTN